MESREKKNIEAGIIMILIAVIIVLCGAIIYDKFFRVDIKNNINTDSEKVEKTTDEDGEMHKAGNLYKNASSKDALCTTDSKTPYAFGTKYVCNNLGDGRTYTFYVLSDATNTGKVDLIMDRDYIVSSYYESENIDANNLGPYSLIKKLPTKNMWSNIEEIQDNTYDYSGYVARLPKASEIAKACDMSNFNELDSTKVYENENSSSEFLFMNSTSAGYYTETPSTSNLVWVVDKNTKTLHTLDGTNKLGIRPVITLSK